MIDRRAETFHVVTVVWGQPYVELFLDVALPNQATPGNLGALPAGSRYRVFTSPEDADALAASPALGRVKELLPVDLVVMPALSDASTGALLRMTAAHRRALAEAREARAALVFLNADHFMSEGALAAVVRRHEAGSRAIVCAGLRVNRDTFIAALRARGDVRALAPRELVSLALERLHSFTRAHMADGEWTARRPIGVYWNVPGEGILARCLYMHPRMVDPVRPEALPGGTIDQHYLVHACPIREQIHVVSDSDELAVFEMSHLDAADTEMGAGGISPWRAARVLSRCDSHQRSYWTLPIHLHTRDIDDAWSPVEARAARFACQVMRLRVPALWAYFASRRLRPVRRRAGEFTKRLRAATRPLSARRMRRTVALAVRPLQRLPERAVRGGRSVVHRTRRSLGLLAHSAARPLQKFRKRTVRAGRRVLGRARVGL